VVNTQSNNKDKKGNDHILTSHNNAYNIIFCLQFNMECIPSLLLSTEAKVLCGAKYTAHEAGHGQP